MYIFVASIVLNLQVQQKNPTSYNLLYNVGLNVLIFILIIMHRQNNVR